MNTIKKITAISILGIIALGTTASATHRGPERVISDLVYSQNQGDFDATGNTQSVDNPDLNMIASDNSQETTASGKNSRFRPWMIAIPVAAVAIALTGGIAAAPIIGGAVSAETAMGLALAAAIL